MNLESRNQEKSNEYPEIIQNENLIEEVKNKLLVENTDIDEMQEVMNLIATSISEQYYAIYHIWMDTHTYVCFQEQMPGILSVIGAKGYYEPAWDSYISDYIEKEDQNAMYEFSEFSTLSQRLSSASSIMQVYRRKGLGWARGRFIVAKRDANGNVSNVIYAVSDINEEMVQKQRQKQAVFEAIHDPLTGVYNRKGFKQILQDLEKESSKTQSCKIGFALIDVDNFKILNDQYGHEFGDKVLVRIAKFLSETFHSEDRIFRFGGDEFGVLLKNATDEVWDIICKKLEYVHNTLKKTFSEQRNITLSMGICFSDEGYSEELFKLADEALYETKRNGRAGCTLIDKNHVIKKEWKNVNSSVQVELALDHSSTGMYRMEFPKKLEETPRMICNETTKILLGIGANATPEECYQAWANGINPSYVEALWETRHIMVAGNQAECTYQWKHPKWGMIYVRSGGYGETLKDMEILHGYHHALKDTSIVERKGKNRKILEAMQDLFIASYYIELQNRRFNIIKEVECVQNKISGCCDMNDAFTYFKEHIVKPSFAEQMEKFYCMDTLPQRLDKSSRIACKYQVNNDELWYQASFFPVDYNANGELTHVLFTVTQSAE